MTDLHLPHEDELTESEWHAQRDKLANLSDFAEWLHCELNNKQAQDLGYVPSPFGAQKDQDHWKDRMEDLPTHLLIQTALNHPQWAGIAMDIVKERYLKS